MSEDEMAGLHHGCNEHELGKIPGDADRDSEVWCAVVLGVAKSPT